MLNSPDPGFDWLMEGGKPIAHWDQDELEELAKRLGVRPLMEFFSASPDEVAEMAGLSADEIDVPDEQWFEPREGLRTVRSLKEHLASIPGAEEVVLDLADMERVLQEADGRGLKWHLMIDA